MTILRSALSLVALGGFAFGSSPQAWETSTYQDFLSGRFEGVSLGRDGRVTLAPQLDKIFTAEQPIVWSVAQTPDGASWLGTGHGGRLYRVDADGSGALVFTAPEPEIFAVAADAQGRVYAATSPNGKVYRIENGQATEYFAPEAQYILSLAVAPDGALFVGTGIEGKIFRVRAAGQGEVYYESGQSNVTSLAVDGQGRLLAGTDPNGILYRIEAPGRAFALYDADLPEIRALHVAADGTVYAAALGGSLAKQTAAATAAAQSAGAQVTITTTVTGVAGENTQQGGNVQPAGQNQSRTSAATTTTSPVVEYSGVEKAALYRIAADNTVEKLWTSMDENLYDIAPSGSSLLMTTDNQGRLYELTQDRKLKLVVETRESEAVRLAPTSKGVLLVTGHLGALYRIGEQAGQAGEFESPVHDAGAVARWGELSWRGESCNGCQVAIRTRSGNSARPDATWSDWSEAASNAAGSPVASPNARYIQWKAELRGSGASSPSLDYLRLAYLPQNTAPSLTSITFSSLQAPAATTSSSASSSPQTYSLTITATGEVGASSVTGTPSQPVTRATRERLQIIWVAEDAEGDRLEYSVYFRAEDQNEWKPLRENIAESSVLVDSDTFADGRYYFRVTASDRLSNAPPSDRSDELISPPVLIDRTPPTVTIDGSTVKASDEVSPLTRCEYSVDAGEWIPLAATDGVVDSRNESFTLPTLEGTGERLLGVRCYDSANNAGGARRILR